MNWKAASFIIVVLAASRCSSGSESSSSTAVPTRTSPPPATPAVAAGPVALPSPVTASAGPFTGRLVFATFDPTQSSPSPYLARLDLATMALATVWTPPSGAWLGSMALSPDGQTLALVYAPPPPPGQVSLGYPGLFLLPGRCLHDACNGLPPEPLVDPIDGESFFAPAWTPDGALLYFSHVAVPPGELAPVYDIQRIPVAGGERQVIVERATWPQISPDGQTLAYVAFDYDLKLNDLFFASLDGTNATHPMALGSFLAVDAPVFSPDGRFIYFSATGAGPTSRELSDSRPLSWLERLMGIQIAHANGAPSDWWSLPTAGGDPVQLTMIAASGLSGTFSPDGLDFATVSTSGLGVMQADGADFTWLFDGAAVGAVLWLP